MNKHQCILIAALALIATFARAQTVEYIHTDALGSPVAVTNASGAVIERTVYEPYGAVINRSLTNGPGYTGHVADAVTGLNYMQQRYYDPGLGRFLSSDPVTVTSVGGNFNRYWYTNNNPYKYIDPDGRQTCTGSIIKKEDCSSASRVITIGGNDSEEARDASDGTLAKAVEEFFADATSDLEDYMGLVKASWGEWPGDGSLESNLAGLPILPGVALEGSAGRLALGFRGLSQGGNFVRGMTVIGRYPLYIEGAQAAGANYFNLGRLGNILPKRLVWYLNTKFLDRAVARGDHIVLARPFNPINDANSWLADEIAYLSSRYGYVLSDGVTMVPP